MLYSQANPDLCAEGAILHLESFPACGDSVLELSHWNKLRAGGEDGNSDAFSQHHTHQLETASIFPAFPMESKTDNEILDPHAL